ncbi:unnamed protein product [Mytilus coruscus]|uniref:WSC domain-containing protein n=1 Tax=Mytilus coruscus TaxID=42192 RepID=A0A6J8E484_MYTCO|nr:unnamed protein product [Mytilus coruscus]
MTEFDSRSREIFQSVFEVLATTLKSTRTEKTRLGRVTFYKVIHITYGAGLSLFGCYWNDDGATLSDKQSTTSSTVDCIHLCLTVNPSYIYAGTQKDPKSCYCGETLHGQASTRSFLDIENQCSAPCPVVVTDTCGGYYRLAVYNISGLKVPVILIGNDITTESTTDFTTTHRQVAFSTSEGLFDKTNSSIRSTYRKPTYSLERNTSPNLDQATDSKTSFSILGLTVYNSTHTKGFQTTQNIKQETTTPFSVKNNCTQRKCICGKWSHLNGLNLSRDELSLILKSDLDTIHQNLIIDVKTTSAFRNKKISAPDYRKSSATIARLKAELERKNIAFPLNAKRLTLVRLLKRYENSDSITSNTTNARGEEARGEDTRGEEPINGSAVYHHALPLQNARVDGDPRSHDTPNTNNNENTLSNDNRVLIGIVSKLSSTERKVNLLLQARNENTSTSRIAETPNAYVSAPVDNVSNIINHNSTNSSQSWSNFNLQSAYNALQNTRTAPNAAAGSEEQLLNMGNSGNMVRTAHGYSAETLPFVETISPQLRKNIISGMDINLTSLLIPYYSGSGTHELSLSEDQNNKSDPRSSRSLSLGEFIQAFGIYKNIMCTTFPHRRSELDLYERDLVDMATRYPGKGFYEYHKRFSADAAAHLRHNNIPVDWSIRNNTLFCNIFANIKPNTCSICSSTFHSSSYCNQSNNNNRNTTGSNRSDQDIHGRERSYHGGKEICNNFNGKTGVENLPVGLYNDNSCTVLLQDITVDPTKQFFIFRLRSSKRDPFRQGVNIIIYENDTFKPVDTMSKYLSIRYNNGALPKSPLFVEDEFQSSPLSRETFISSLRQLLDTLGYNTVKFCGHSFRIGAATSAAACCVEDHIIQTLGRWSSDCYIRYIRTDAKVLKRAQHDMCFHN